MENEKIKNKDRIIVSLTTWKKRDKIAARVIEHLQNQTVTPDNIILWLSESEYEGSIPQHLQECLDKGYLTDIRFVPGNTKCYKKWEVFKEFDGENDYNILLDDDYFYPDNCIETLYKSAKEQNTPCCYFEKTFDYVGVQRKETSFRHSSLKNQLYPGFCCIPPGFIDRNCELFNEHYVSIRDKYNPVSDDLWFGWWFKSHNIPVYGVYKWDSTDILKWVVEDSQKEGLWESENRILINGIQQVVRNFATLVEATDSIELAKKIYPNFDIEKCSEKSKIDNEENESVSIIMTAYKTKKYIKQAIDSVYSQTYFKNHSKWELLIGVDDCRETLNYLQGIMKRYDDHLKVFMMDSNKGTYVTSNTLLTQAKYNWVLRFDSDDVMMNDMIDTLMTESKDYDCCIYRYNVANEHMIKTSVKCSNIFANGSIFVKRSVISQLGGYKPWPVSADAELIFCRISKFFKVKRIERPLFYYRVHKTSLTHNALTNGRSEIRQKYNAIWKNENLNNIKEAVIETVTNTFKEVQASEHLTCTVYDDKTINNILAGKKTVIYTCVLNGEQPQELPYKIEGYDYVCFSNVPIENDMWTIRIIPENSNTVVPSNKLKEVVKICPHIYLPEYEYSIYVENSNDIDRALNHKLKTNKSVYMVGCDVGDIYKRAAKCSKLKIDSAFVIRSQIFKYQRENYPTNYGMVETNIIIRKHNTEYCKKLMNMWLNEVVSGSYIDNLSFNYCLWKIGDREFEYIK